MTQNLTPAGLILPAAGWYPDPTSAVHERWWSGIAWTEHAREVPVPESSTAVIAAPTWASARLRNTPSTRALVLGVIVAVFAAVPYLNIAAIGLAVLAIVLGIVGARRSILTGTGLAKSITGIGLAIAGLAVASTLGVLFTGSVGSPTLEPEARLKSPSITAPYTRVGDETMMTLLKTPDAASGSRVILNGKVVASDRASCSFTASVTNANRDGRYLGTAWFARATDCTSLRRGDLVKIWAVVQGTHATTTGKALPGLSVTKVTTQ